MAPFSSKAAGRTQQVSPPKIVVAGTSRPATVPTVPHKIHYLEEEVQENDNYRVQWSNWMSDGQKKSFYKHVCVLLISWHPECDDMAVEEEVKRLKDVFRDTYNYKVKSVWIDSREKAMPQSQANYAVTQFVLDHDDEDSLFIVYYAGHGSPGKIPGDLKMSGRRRSKEKQRLSQQFSHITWNYVENNLKDTRADVFLIFDCCHACDLGRESVLNSRSFEYLAASTSIYTRSPGEQSFTSALIWALKDLAGQMTRGASQGSPMFTTSKLAKRICDAPNFPPEQTPLLTTRDLDAWQHIILAPLPRNGGTAPVATIEEEDEDEDESVKAVPQFLSLTFHFKDRQDESDLKKLADHLKKFMKLDNTNLHKVQWGAIWDGLAPTPGSRFRDCVKRVIAHEHEHSPMHPISLPDNGLFITEHRGTLEPSSERTPLLSAASSDIHQDDSSSYSIWHLVASYFWNVWKSTMAAWTDRQSNSLSSNIDTKTP